VVRLFGALPEPGGVRFRAPAPASCDLDVEILSGAAAGVYRLVPSSDGVQERFVEAASTGDTYSYLIDGGRRPDPASRFQPEGVHGPSQIVDPGGFHCVTTPGRSHPTIS